MAAPYQYSHYQQQTPYQQPPSQDYSGYNPHYPSQSYPPQQPQTQAYALQQYSPQQPQQYVPQQSQPQYAPQQYQTTQSSQNYGAQYQPYQPSQPSYAQPSAQPAAQACFNCGAPGHWAQDCPEPKRDVPAGQVNPGQHRRHGIAPHNKRSNQIVTKFGPPPAQYQSSPQGYGQPHSAGGYQQYPSPYTPSSPPSASSVGQAWPQHAQHPQQNYQQYQQPAQNGQYYQPPPTPQQMYPTPATPAASQSYGPPHAPQQSPQGSQYGFDFQSPHAQYPPHNWHQSPTPSQQQTGRPESASSHFQLPPSHPGSGTRSTSIHSRPTSPTSERELEEGEAVELEDDDLSTLDVPDLPQSTEKFGDAVVPPIAMPLPSNSVVADALAPFARAPVEDGSICRSKYLRDLGEDSLSQNIAGSTYWKELKEDTIFLPITRSDEVLSVEECRSRIRERQKPQAEVRQESQHPAKTAAPPRKDANECAESLQQLEKALAEAKAKQAELIRKRQAELEKKRKAKEDRQSPALDQPSKDEFNKGENRSDLHNSQARPPRPSPHDHESSDAVGSVAGNGRDVKSAPRQPTQASPTNAESPHRNLPGVDSNGSSAQVHCHHIPPPPPPLESQNSNMDDRSPLSGEIDPYGYGTNPFDEGPGYFPYQSEHSNSTSRFRSDQPAGRKRNYESSSDESDAPPRRQEDDVTPKLKRRQPKVAEAYSRRW